MHAVSRAEEDEAFVFGEVSEVLDVEGGEGQVVGQAARGDPGVVLGSWSGAACCVGGDLAPDAGDVVGVGERGARGRPGGELGASRAAPLAQRGPAGEFPGG